MKAAGEAGAVRRRGLAADVVGGASARGLDGAQRAAGAGVTIRKGPQPAFTAGQQERPSLTTWLSGASSPLASASTSLWKPLTLDGEAVVRSVRSQPAGTGR
jgi:hypothetical protein